MEVFLGLFQLSMLCNKHRCVKEQLSCISHSPRGWIDCAQRGWRFCNQRRLGLKSSWRSAYWPAWNARMLRWNRCGSEGSSVWLLHHGSFRRARLLAWSLGTPEACVSRQRDRKKGAILSLMSSEAMPGSTVVTSYSRRGLICCLLIEKVSKNL